MEITALHLLLLIPCLGAFCSYFIGKRVPHSAGLIGSAAAGGSFLVVLGMVFGFWPAPSGVVSFGHWLSFSDMNLPFSLRYDGLTQIMCLIITGVGFLIHLYSIGYMSHDEGVHRFFAYLNLFLAAMLSLVLGNNLLVLFVGWEGVGLCSYLLIGFWFKNTDYASAGKKAFIMNRIGDAGFLIAIFLLYKCFGTLEITELLSKLSGSEEFPKYANYIALALFVAATGKSAQIPLFTWLPDAMAGPTPVSALIHAATMVTAGIYLLARLNLIFVAAPMVSAIVCLVGIATAVMAASIALFQYDIKKVLAYSTVSQLGFMFAACGAGVFAAGIFHVVTHAFFKACMFLGAGSVIHGCSGEQDIRLYGGLKKYMPLTCVAFAASVLSIAGIYPFAGYASKHEILSGIASTTNPFLIEYQWLLSGIMWCTALTTALYMARLFCVTFLGAYRGAEHPHEAPSIMTGPVLLLGLLGVIGGIAFGPSIHHSLDGIVQIPDHHEMPGLVEVIIGSLPGLIGLSIGFLLFTKFSALPRKWFMNTKPLSTLIANKYYVDEIYDFLVVQRLRGFSQFLEKTMEQKIVVGGIRGLGYVTEASGEVLRRSASGLVANYLMWMWVALVLLLLLYVAM